MNIIEKIYTMNGTLQKRNQNKRIILHHAAAVNCTADDVDRWHKGNGWTCIGYHFFVNKKGEIYRGRPEDTVGAHAYGSNSDSIGICFEGNFEIETMPEEQKRTGQELVAYLKEKYGIAKVQGHIDVCSTSCPGRNFPFKEIVEGSIKEESEEDDMVEYQNGSTVEDVYETSAFINKIGKLNTWEKCKGKKIANGVYLVLYKIDGTNTYKSGFVKYHGGIK